MASPKILNVSDSIQALPCRHRLRTMSGPRVGPGWILTVLNGHDINSLYEYMNMCSYIYKSGLKKSQLLRYNFAPDSKNCSGHTLARRCDLAIE